MKTTKKGMAFEKRVFDVISSELDNGRLGFDSRCSKIHTQKGYYSRDRGSNIVVDISIEVWLPSAPNWSLLWVCECKDYKSPIPVDDVEEFKAKLDQITGANRKGVIASTGAFQKSALAYAKANGIGVIRILPDEQISHVAFKMPIGSSDPTRITAAKVEKSLLNQDYISENRDMLANIEGRNFSNWRRLLKHALRTNS